ncbi:hypothetical protein ACLB2K_028442 [Fragaria x ananassa]
MEKQGRLVVEKVGGRSTVTRSFSKYPLKLIIPRKVGSSKAMLSGFRPSPMVVALSLGILFLVNSPLEMARVGSNALLAVIPDPVTCFSTARYSQKQIFRVASDSSLVLVDWITNGRHESGEKWDFDLYKSANHIFIGDEPLFLDMVHLENGSISSIAERMQDYQVNAMRWMKLMRVINRSKWYTFWLLYYRPKIKHIQDLVQENVERMMAEQLHNHSTASGRQQKINSDYRLTKPSFIASSSIFGPKGIGVVVRIAATTTESVYKFLQHQLAGMEPLLGVSPYH